MLLAAPVDQNQSLALVNPGVPDRFAFPAAGIDQPCCGQFDRAVVEPVMHDARFARDDVLALLGRHAGVLEEAASVA